MLTGALGTGILVWAIGALIAYLIGAIPTAYLAVRWRLGQDIRGLGDGNSGAANAGAVLGTRFGLVIGALDIGKGLAVVLLAKLFLDSQAAQMIAGLLVIAGHNWPVYLQGRGGRGAATAVGVLLAIVPVVSAPVAVLALIVLYLGESYTKALAALYIPLPFLAFWPAGYSYPLVAYALAVPVLVGLSHYLSLRRPRIPLV